MSTEITEMKITEPTTTETITTTELTTIKPPTTAPQKGKAGRPLKYTKFLECLENDTLYTPATILNNGDALGLIDSNEFNESSEYKAFRIKVRHTLARLAKNHGFPPEGDGNVCLSGQALARGWYGSRWKEAANLPLDVPVDVRSILFEGETEKKEVLREIA